jgi:hypothetical protein
MMASDSARKVPSSSCRVGMRPLAFFRQEVRGARLALQHVALDQPVGQAEMGQRQPHLVAVPRVHEVVQRHHRRHSAATASAASALPVRYA